ncbi:hypothetical protein CLF_108645 [Clonorchis sinensis]|uniref:Uncharacterized protein n=1 Tax=Clonorchis sinensis TaxID=79923 RepID=G7YIB8_CLOSI|nr:hypothetical protein CLF_108645 [Clonorchis sinensis]
MFRPRTSGDAEAAAAVYAGVSIVLSERAEESLSDWVSFAVRLATLVKWPHTRLKSTRQRLVAFVGLFGMGILFIFTPLSGERSSSSSDVVIPVSPHQSTALGSINDGINDAYPKAVRDLNSGHLICESNESRRTTRGNPTREAWAKASILYINPRIREEHTG